MSALHSVEAFPTYHLEELRRNLFLVVATVIAGVGVLYGAFAVWLLAGTGLGVVDLLVAGVPTAGLLIVAAAIVRATRTIRLELSEAGPTLYLPGAVVEAMWEDVVAVGPAPFGFLAGDALLLGRPARVRTAWWFLFQRELLHVAIPLAPFALPFRGSRLEAQLRTMIPAALEAPTTVPF